MLRLRSAYRFAAAIIFFWAACVHAQRPVGFQKKGPLPVIPLTVGQYPVQVEVAATPADRERGLMFRESLGPNDGMLFIFEETAGHCFWMKNTPLPLSIAFINNQGIITDIDEMAANTTHHHCPTRAGRYALEMRQGWFASKGISAGTRIRGLP